MGPQGSQQCKAHTGPGAHAQPVPCSGLEGSTSLSANEFR